MKMKAANIARFSVGALFSLLGVLFLANAKPQAVSYHLLKKVSLSATPGGEYFDYVTVDSGARRVYASHGTEVAVIDADSGAQLGTISGLKRCHGVALDKELGKGFITDGTAAEIVVFDIASLKVTGRVKGEPDADGIVYDPASKMIFAFNGDSKSVTVVNPITETVVKSIPLGGGPEFPAADGKGMVYDNNEETNAVVAIDSRSLTIKARWPVAPAGGPTAMAMDTQHRRLFSSGRNPAMLVMMDADSGKVIQSFPISAGVDANVFEPETGLLFVSTREGKVHIFHEDSPDKLSAVQTLDTEYGAKTMGVDSKTHNLYLTTADFGPAPAATPQQANPQRRAVAGTFHLLIYGR
jgi:YVTN family beta-propeller protein